MCFEANGELQI